MFINLTPNVYLVKPPGGGRFPHCYCVYIEGEPKTLIDTSCGNENLKELHSKGVDIIVNTHFHEDHILNNYQFPLAQVWAHGLDAPAIRSVDVFIKSYGLLFDGEELGRNFTEGIQLHPSPVHRELADGEMLDLSPWHLSVVHTPGHTPGHIALWEEKYGILIAGDIDLSGFGPWYGHMCSNLDDFLASIELCRQIAPRIIISGHKGLIDSEIDPRLQLYRDTILRKEEQVLLALSEPKTLGQLVDLQIFYGPRLKLDAFFRWFETMAIYQHLQRLIRLRLVAQLQDEYYRL